MLEFLYTSDYHEATKTAITQVNGDNQTNDLPVNVEENLAEPMTTRPSKHQAISDFRAYRDTSIAWLRLVPNGHWNSVRDCGFNTMILDFLVQFSFIDFWHPPPSLRPFYTKFLAPTATHSFYRHNCYNIYGLGDDVGGDVLLYEGAVGGRRQQNGYWPIRRWLRNNANWSAIATP